MLKKYLSIAVFIVVLAVTFIWINYADRIQRLQVVGTLFTGAEQIQNFNRMHEMFPVNVLPPAEQVLEFESGVAAQLPTSFMYRGAEVLTSEFITRTDSGALLVLKDGKVTFEQYWQTGGRDQTWLSMSVAKSFISALIGIAVDQGLIGDITQPVTDYVPELAGSAYDNVRIKDILQMSSGASWNEDYGDPESDINRFGRVFALGVL